VSGNKKLTQIGQIIADSNFTADTIIKILSNVDSDQLYEIAKFVLTIPVEVIIYIINRLLVHPAMLFPNCSIICLRNLKQARELLNMIIKYYTVRIA
jgi:hypothetical protein